MRDFNDLIAPRRSVDEYLRLMLPDELSNRRRAYRLAPVFGVGPSAVLHWLSFGAIPDRAALIAALFIGDVALVDIEDWIEEDSLKLAPPHKSDLHSPA